jgi:hypothetical protein
MNTNFEERLLGAIMEERARMAAANAGSVAAGSAQRRARRSVMRLSVVLAGVAAISAVFMLRGQGVPPAHAVDKSADGSVRVQINAFVDSADLEAELAGAGIMAEIDYLPAGQTCQQLRGERAAANGRMKVGVAGDGKGIEFEIGKGQVEAGETLVLAISVDPAAASRPPVATSLQIVKGSVVPCEMTAMPLPTGRSVSENGTGPGRPTDDMHQRDLPPQRD